MFPHLLGLLICNEDKFLLKFSVLFLGLLWNFLQRMIEHLQYTPWLTIFITKRKYSSLKCPISDNDSQYAQVKVHHFLCVIHVHARCSQNTSPSPREAGWEKIKRLQKSACGLGRQKPEQCTDWNSVAVLERASFTTSYSSFLAQVPAMAWRQQLKCRTQFCLFFSRSIWFLFCYIVLV